jgi:transcriptional antiterminator NusG
MVMNIKNKQGKRGWYVVQTASGHENKVKGHIEKRIQTMEVSDRIFSVVIPERTTVRVKGGKRVEKKEKEYPGYVLVDMVLDEDTWRTVREAPGVLGFVGDKNKPTTLSESEARKILRKNALLSDDKMSEKKVIDFKPGDTVKIQAGPFEDFIGEVAEINEERMTVKVNVIVFGRSTPTEVPVNHVDKVA